MLLKLFYKSGYTEEFSEKEIDCSKLTIMGHAGQLVSSIFTGAKGYYKFDNYTAVFLDEIISVRVIK